MRFQRPRLAGWIVFAAWRELRATAPRKTRVVRALIFLITLGLAGCESTSSHYDTLASAVAADQVVKGWVPEGLPASTRDITVVRYVEAAMGSGTFRVHPDDVPALLARYAPYAGQESRYEEQNEHIRRLIARNYRAVFYIASHGASVVMCDPETGDCEFENW